MSRERWKHPLYLKTGRLTFTPVLRSTGERLALEVDYASFTRSKAPGFHGNTQDLKSGKRYAVYGKECDIPGCHCDAWVEELEGEIPSQTVPEDNGSIGFMRDADDELDEIVEDAMRRRQISAWLPNREDFAALEAISQAKGQSLNALLDEALRQFLRLMNEKM